MKKILTIGGIFALQLAVLCGLSACKSGFSDDDVKKIQDDIRAEFSKKQGVEVLDVQMLKESPNKLTGFAKIKVALPFGLHKEVTKNCSALKGEGDGKSMWKCD